MARCTGSAGCSRGSMVSSRYSAIAFDSNNDTLPSTRSTGTFLCGEMARNQSGRLSRSIWRNSKSTPFSRSTMAARCTHGQVLKLTSRYFDMTLRSNFVLGFEIQFDLHVVRIAEEDLPARAARHLIDAVRDALAGEVFLHCLEAAAAERHVIDDAGIRPLLAVGLRDVIDVQHRMPGAVEPRAGEIERWSKAVLEAQHLLVEFDGFGELAGRDVVVVEHADAHVHRASPWSAFRSRIGPTTGRIK